MTRFLAALILGASLLGLAACSGGSNSLPPTAQVQHSQNPDGGGIPNL